MKPRIIVTTKVLAVAAASMMGCAPRADPGAAAITPESTQGPMTTASGAPSGETATPPAETAGAAPRVAPGEVAPAVAPNEKIALLQLQFALAELPLKEAVAQNKRFRPLCDAQGYPLVGNVARKGGMDEAPQLQASKFCSELRRLKRL